MKKNLLKGIVSVLCLGALAGCGNTGESTDGAFDNSNSITVVSREEGSGTRGAFTELFGVLEKSGDTEQDNTTDEAVIANKTGVVMTTVAQEENAIGYISLGSLNNTVKSVKIDGVESTVDNILNGSYGIARPFLIVTKDDTNELSKDFIKFILSADGQNVISESYVPSSTDAQAYVSSDLSGKLSVGGSTSVAPIMEKLKEEYISLNPNVTIDIQETGSSAGINGTIEGTLDIGMSSRDLKESEVSEVTENVIAYDGLAVIVNNVNPIEDLTVEDVKNIFTGNITTWEELYE